MNYSTNQNENEKTGLLLAGLVSILDIQARRLNLEVSFNGLIGLESCL